MRIIYIAAGAGDMLCGSCLRDAALARALMHQGHDVMLTPVYTPLRGEGPSDRSDRSDPSARSSGLFYGGINVYLQSKFAFFRRTPRWLDRLFDSAAALSLVSRFRSFTTAQDLAQLTLSTLQGPSGPQIKELERLAAFLESQPRPDAIVLPNSMLAGMAAFLRRRLKAPVISQLSGEDLFIDEFPAFLQEQVITELRRRARELDGLIAHNRFYARYMADYLDLPPEAFRVVPLGIDCSGYAPPEQERAWPEVFTLGYLGRLIPQKGLARLIEAFRILKSRPETASCRLKVAGYLGPEYRAWFHSVQTDARRSGL
ncbi:MAG: glycosyltransferase family 4 protein, partial [Candidatus Sumerlaeota bacterium]|nr:glycosyltransferase family 4 protein [Candidatus Sumerlaeota bacterium]